MPVSKKLRTFGQSDADLDALFAGMDRTADLPLKMLDVKAIVKAAPSPLTKSRSQTRAAIRAGMRPKGM